MEHPKQEGITKRYISPDGVVYESYEAYCNSMDLDDYTIMLKLHSGIRIPINDYERRLEKPRACDPLRRSCLDPR